MNRRSFDTWLSVELMSARTQGIAIRIDPSGYFPWEKMETLLIREGFRCVNQSEQNNQDAGGDDTSPPEHLHPNQEVTDT